MAETDILVTRETKRSFGLARGTMAILMLGLPFLGRQRIRVTTERVIVEEGFWTKTRDDVEVFRIRDVVSKQAFWHRLLGIGDVIIKATEGRTDESHVLRGVPDPVAVSEAIRTAWNASARPRTSTNLD
ncbi:PH domain-containing protein [Falsiroseomonas sp. HC035]|uniref:PH domain-containing protein n=1 Tax=Falsiroseomonas sp. HC035 TaxID=3390999 RepID=UPI003D310297